MSWPLLYGYLLCKRGKVVSREREVERRREVWEWQG
jgi:hypothetical protein